MQAARGLCDSLQPPGRAQEHPTAPQHLTPCEADPCDVPAWWQLLTERPQHPFWGSRWLPPPARGVGAAAGTERCQQHTGPSHPQQRAESCFQGAFPPVADTNLLKNVLRCDLVVWGAPFQGQCVRAACSCRVLRHEEPWQVAQ